MKWQTATLAALSFRGLALTRAFTSLPQVSTKKYSGLRMMRMSTSEKISKVPKPYGDIPPEKREIWRPRPPSTVAGTIPIESGRLLISDPCFEQQLGERIWCMAEIDMVPNANYEVRYTKYGVDLGILGLYHPDYKSAVPNELAFEDVGVDSATISFSDANHKVALGGSDDERREIIKDVHDCAVVDWHGMNVALAWTDDGGYPVLVARNEDDKIIAAEVHFDWDDD